MLIGPAQALALLVAALRLAELAWARRNTQRLVRAGGIEVGARHYPLFVLLHGAWLASIFALAPAGRRPSWALVGVLCLLLAARVWTIGSLGRFWTTRVISLPRAPLVRRGPYRFLRHPNYLIVAGEIAVLPLAFGLWRVALVASVLNAALLWHRIAVEEAALAPRRAAGGASDAVSVSRR